MTEKRNKVTANFYEEELDVVEEKIGKTKVINVGKHGKIINI